MPKKAAKKKDRNRFYCLKNTVLKAIKKLQKHQDAEHYKEVELYLEKMYEDIVKYSLLIEGLRNPSIGVFGCPSRGKSTLLNVLLGVDIMPRNPKPGTTRYGTELRYKEPESIEPYKITVEYASKPSRIDHYTFDDAKVLLENLSSQEVYSENPDISRIIAEGPFKSYIGNDIVFVDTPGAVELETNTEEPMDNAVLTHNYQGDNDHALAVLDKVDIIVFCMRYGGQYERNDKNFYNKYLTPKEVNPINVINVDFNSGESRSERDGKTNDQIKADLQKDYRLLPDHTVVVSSKKALDIIAPENSNKKIANIIKTKFKKDDDLKEFKVLKDLILRKAGNKDAAAITERIKRYEDKYNELKDNVEKKGILFPKLSKSWKIKEKIKRALIIILLVCLILLAGLVVLSL